MLITGFVSSPASAASSQTDVLGEARDFFESYGLSEETIDSLEHKLATEGTLHSMDGSDPVDVQVTETATATVTLETFEDGSIRVSSVDKPLEAGEDDGIFMPMAISQCQGRSGSGYVSQSNCLAFSSNGVTSMRFRFDYSHSNGGPSSISSGHSAASSSTYGSITTPVRSSWRQHSSSVQNAVLTYRSVYTGPMSTETWYLSVYLPQGKTPYTSSH